MTTVERILGTELERNVFSSILKNLPNIYHTFYDIPPICTELATELALNGNLDNEILEQFFVETATWGLSEWERILGIQTNPSLTYSERRYNVLAAVRSNSSVTPLRLKQVIASYAGGDCDIVETTPNVVGVKFTGVYGIPSNITDLQFAVRKLLPAHLDVTYSFKYATWDDITKKNYLWSGVDAKAVTWTAIENGGLI